MRITIQNKVCLQNKRIIFLPAYRYTYYITGITKYPICISGCTLAADLLVILIIVSTSVLLPSGLAYGTTISESWLNG